MKIKTIKSLYISLDELKEAISNWLRTQEQGDLADHMEENLCEFDWFGNNDESSYLVIDMDGTFENDIPTNSNTFYDRTLMSGKS